MFEMLKDYPILYDFLVELHWQYLITLLVIMFGIKHTKELDWFTDYLTKKKMEKGISWIAAIIVALFFIIFRWLNKETTFDSEYVASLLRTLLVGVILSKLVIDNVTNFIKDKFTKK